MVKVWIVVQRDRMQILITPLSWRPAEVAVVHVEHIFLWLGLDRGQGECDGGEDLGV